MCSQETDELGKTLAHVNLDIGGIEHCVSVSEEDLKNDQALRKDLESLQGPFTWEVSKTLENSTMNTICTLEDKQLNTEDEDTFQWCKFVLNLVLSYEYYHNNELTKSMGKLLYNEKLLSAFTSKGVLEMFYLTTKEALYHVVYASLAYLHFNSHDVSATKNMLSRITREEDMDDRCKAALSGIHAACLMEYGYSGNISAIKYLKMAESLDPCQGEWKFLLGKCLIRTRHINNLFEVPSMEEFRALEEAVEMTKNPSYIIFLAQTYMEAVSNLFSQNVNLDSMNQTMNHMKERALALYKEALELAGDCAYINIRCAKGFLKLRDDNLAKACITKAILLAPNNIMGNHMAGKVYEHIDRNWQKAKEFYLKAAENGSFGAYMDLFRLKYKQNCNYDALSDLQGLLEKFKELPLQEELFCQIGSYYLFIKNDLEKAFEYFKKVIEKNPGSDRLKTHKNMFLPGCVNIYDVLCDEARLTLQNQSEGSYQNQSLYQHIIFLCSEHSPDFLQHTPVSCQELLEKVSWKSRYREKSRGEPCRSRDSSSESCRTYISNESKGTYHSLGSYPREKEQTGQRIRFYSNSESGVNDQKYRRQKSYDRRVVHEENWRKGPRELVGNKDNGPTRAVTFDGEFVHPSSINNNYKNKNLKNCEQNWRTGPRDFGQSVAQNCGRNTNSVDSENLNLNQMNSKSTDRFKHKEQHNNRASWHTKPENLGRRSISH
uniref:(California timema) hypothetical protein n=1 Tax=Timema californicum TaxID=61474 RepID=A0A7R9P9C7_TIMCA|nr:unnamed protein product [Timema californicum]